MKWPFRRKTVPTEVLVYDYYELFRRLGRLIYKGWDKTDAPPFEPHDPNFVVFLYVIARLVILNTLPKTDKVFEFQKSVLIQFYHFDDEDPTPVMPTLGEFVHFINNEVKGYDQAIVNGKGADPLLRIIFFFLAKFELDNEEHTGQLIALRFATEKYVEIAAKYLRFLK